MGSKTAQTHDASNKRALHLAIEMNRRSHVRGAQEIHVIAMVHGEMVSQRSHPTRPSGTPSPNTTDKFTFKYSLAVVFGEGWGGAQNKSIIRSDTYR
jgi:hypothetical protein